MHYTWLSCIKSCIQDPSHGFDAIKWVAYILFMDLRQSIWDCNALFSNWRDYLSWSLGWVFHGECTNVYGYILDSTYNDLWHWLSSSHNVTKLLCCMSSQPWESIELVLRSSIALTCEWDLKMVIYSLWIGSTLIKVGSNKYSQDRHHDIS